MDLAVAYRRADQPAESNKAFTRGSDRAQKEVARNIRDGEARSRLAFMSACLGDRKGAEQQIAEALGASPDSRVARGMAVWTYEALDKRNEALKILSVSPNDVLMDAARWPDLQELHRDSRFKELLASRQIKE
jgi:hypothetical protein